MKKKEHTGGQPSRSGEMQQRRGRKKENPFMTDRGKWLATERQREIAALHQSENPPIPTGYYDQFGDWHESWREQATPRRDARLISLPEGVQVYRDGKIRYYWYDQITDTSRRRLWGVMDQCLQLASDPNIHIWQGRRLNQPPRVNEEERLFLQEQAHEDARARQRDLPIDYR